MQATDGILQGAGHLGTIRSAVLLLLATVVSATLGYAYVEGWGFLDSFYMVIITLSTVGFREVAPLSASGQLITIALIVFGLGSVTLIAASATRLLLEGELRRVMGRRRMERDIAKLSGHYIVCGYGRVGRVVCQELVEHGVRVVVIDNEEHMARRIEEAGLLAVQGDATEEQTLEAAGAARARGLILALPHEADSVYVTLLAKDLYPELFVMARGISDSGDRRLRAAGADAVVSPNIIGAHRMAQTVLRPSVVEFVDIVTGRKQIAKLQLEEQKVSAGSQFAGRTISECDIRQRFGLLVVGILRPDGTVEFNPSPRATIDAGNTLILLGRRDDLDRFAASI